jgi:predicted Rossmann fold nucleotide-binding protein DprA/Smf involved in DNA uptake
MIGALSPNTKAILLLTAPLLVGRSKNKGIADLLTPAEYALLVSYLRQTGRQPADLLGPDADQLLGDCQPIPDHDRLRRLLDRGFLLSQAVERWHARGIWVVSRADEAYPQRLKMRLKRHSPILLYGCGDSNLLGHGGLAVVGSRRVNDSILEYAQGIGRLAAKGRRTLVSGAARGIDQAAMRGALEADGKVTGVLADSLERMVMNREHRNLLLEEQLALVSPYDPNAGFNVGHAMQRNRVIYALADAALVVSAELNKGGTWAGAKEQLHRLRLVPVHVRSTGEPAAGLEALQHMGALPWPNPEGAEGLEAILYPAALKTPGLAAQGDLFNPRQVPVTSELLPGEVASSQPIHG